MHSSSFIRMEKKGGRPASGVTNANGKYELIYLDGVKGARTGVNKVEITTQWPEGEPPMGQSEPIPEKYNSKSTLTADVKPGSNTFDFEIEVKAPKAK